MPKFQTLLIYYTFRKININWVNDCEYFTYLYFIYVHCTLYGNLRLFIYYVTKGVYLYQNCVYFCNFIFLNRIDTYFILKVIT